MGERWGETCSKGLSWLRVEPGSAAYEQSMWHALYLYITIVRHELKILMNAQNQTRSANLSASWTTLRTNTVQWHKTSLMWMQESLKLSYLAPTVSVTVNYQQSWHQIQTPHQKLGMSEYDKYIKGLIEARFFFSQLHTIAKIKLFLFSHWNYCSFAYTVIIRSPATGPEHFCLPVKFRVDF